MDLNQALGQAIKELRITRKLSQESIGASQTYVSNIERGLKSLSVEKLEEFSLKLNVHPLTILTKCYMIRNELITSDELLAKIKYELESDKV